MALEKALNEKRRSSAGKTSEYEEWIKDLEHALAMKLQKVDDAERKLFDAINKKMV